jgi:hypothetical protein
MPSGGSVTVVFAAGANAPKAPVLPLLKVWADTRLDQLTTTAMPSPPSHRDTLRVFMTDSFVFGSVLCPRYDVRSPHHLMYRFPCSLEPRNHPSELMASAH